MPLTDMTFGRTIIYRSAILVLIVLLVCSSAGDFSAYAQAGAQQPPARIAIRAARLIDGKSDAPITNAVILVEMGRIVAVGQNVTIPPGAQVIDLGNATLLPGLIDTHTHLLSEFDRKLEEPQNMLLGVSKMSTVNRALLGAAMAREMLEAGFTSVRDLGNSGLNGDVALRDAINVGWVVGPRIQASTRALAPAGGQFGGMSTEAQKLIDLEYVIVSGVEEARRAVRQAFYDGADCIKVIVNSANVLSLEEMKVIVEEAHRVGRKVAAHAIGDLATRIAAQAGVDSIEHAYTIPDDALKMMAEKRIFLVPTDGPFEFFRDAYVKSRNPSPEVLRVYEARMRNALNSSQQRIQRAVKMGVPIAAGSDTYYKNPGKSRGQTSKKMFQAYAESGMSPMDIIRSATGNAAQLLGWQDRLGTLEARKFADIIAVEDDPSKDIKALDRVRFVMKGGVIIKNESGSNETGGTIK